MLIVFLNVRFFSNWIKIMVRVFVFAFLSNVCFRKFKKFCLLIQWKSKVFQKKCHILCFELLGLFLTDNKQIKHQKIMRCDLIFQEKKLKNDKLKKNWIFVLDYIKMFFLIFTFSKTYQKKTFHSNLEASHNAQLLVVRKLKNEKKNCGLLSSFTTFLLKLVKFPKLFEIILLESGVLLFERTFVFMKKLKTCFSQFWVCDFEFFVLGVRQK